MPKEWDVAPPWPHRDAVARQIGISPVAAQILHNRGLSDGDGMKRFLSPKLNDLAGPASLPGAVEAAERIFTAIRNGRKVVIYGDYDVDGVTAVAILWHAVRLAGGVADFFIPHRLEDGYGLNAEAISQLADAGAELIVTVDCGVTAFEAAEVARRRGVDLIITDHHAPRRDESGHPLLPPASLVVHPDLPGGEGGNRELSGAGVAFKVAWALGQLASGENRVTAEFRTFLVNATGLAALGLVADVVPLIGENRVIALYGLQGLPGSTLPGVRALIEISEASGRKLTGRDIGFGLGPRLNAVGRMGHARLAVDLLTRADADEAPRIARVLDGHNGARRKLEREILSDARDRVRASGQDRDACRGIVLAAEGWHAGVIGIVAARLVEEFHRPTVLIALDNGVGQGSGRSVPGFDLNGALTGCREHLLTCGGHAMAAGLRIESARVDQFRAAFHERAERMLAGADTRPRLRLDGEFALSELDETLLRDLDRMEPFGCGNPAPLLSSRWVNVVGEPRVVGSGGDHLQVVVNEDGVQRKGIGFGLAKHRGVLCDHRRCRLAFVPILNEFNGRRSIELQIKDFQFPG